jgi:hypothetical protein
MYDQRCENCHEIATIDYDTCLCPKCLAAGVKLPPQDLTGNPRVDAVIIASNQNGIRVPTHVVEALLNMCFFVEGGFPQERPPERQSKKQERRAQKKAAFKARREAERNGKPPVVERFLGFPPCTIEIQNAGPEITRTNYFDTPLGRAGAYYLSVNARCLRLLVPKRHEAEIEEALATATRVEIEVPGKSVLLTLIDGTDTPFCMEIPTQMCDRVLTTNAIEAARSTFRAYGPGCRPLSLPLELRVPSDAAEKLSPPAAASVPPGVEPKIPRSVIRVKTPDTYFGAHDRCCHCIIGNQQRVAANSVPIEEYIVEQVNFIVDGEFAVIDDPRIRYNTQRGVIVDRSLNAPFCGRSQDGVPVLSWADYNKYLKG